MKKTRIMAFALVIAVMLMGAGYALWTDTLTIKNTVNTGHLNVDFISGSGTVTFENNTDANGLAVASADPVDFTVDDQATITLKNLYPGAKATVTLKVKNNSTIPVKDGKFEFTKTDADWLQITPDVNLGNMAIGEEKAVTFTVEVPSMETGHTDEENVTFTATATFQQFNK